GVEVKPPFSDRKWQGLNSRHEVESRCFGNNLLHTSAQYFCRRHAHCGDFREVLHSSKTRASDDPPQMQRFFEVDTKPFCRGLDRAHFRLDTHSEPMEGSSYSFCPILPIDRTEQFLQCRSCRS